MAESGYGRIRLFDDFCGPEIPAANAVAYGGSAGGCHQWLKSYKVTGDVIETDTSVVALAKSGGWLRISGNDENGKGCAIGTEVCLSPALNGPRALECRVERAVVTAGVVFAGFCDVNANDVAEVLTATGTTLTLTASDICGFGLDSQLTANADWHMPYNGGTNTGPTDSTLVVSTVTAVAAETNVLRVEIDVDGTARWYIDGILEQTTLNAVDPAVLMAAYVGCWGTTGTAASVDCDYLAVEANRDWTV